MGQDLFTYLPSEIILNILLRLPTSTIMSCKCVCKPLFDLLETREFVKSHLTESVPGLAILLEGEEYPNHYKFIEFADEVNPKRHIFGGNIILNFDLPCNEPLHSSADGLLFLCTRDTVSHAVCCLVIFSYAIQSPVSTSSFLVLESFSPPKPQVQTDTFGFGVSRISGQYKLVRIFHECIREETPVSVKLSQSKCQVYTVGSGSSTWSRIASAGPFKYKGNAKGTFLNGNLHWMVHDFEGSSERISCFDLETELFSTFSPPPCHGKKCLVMCALVDCLCLCDSSVDNEVVIWLMREYGDEKSWTKEFDIRQEYFCYEGPVCPIKVFKNGDILLTLEICNRLLLYFSKTKATLNRGRFCISAITYTPSFLPLKSFAMENVTSF